MMLNGLTLLTELTSTPSVVETSAAVLDVLPTGCCLHASLSTDVFCRDGRCRVELQRGDGPRETRPQ